MIRKFMMLGCLLLTGVALAAPTGVLVKVVSQPDGAKVELNREEIGIAPIVKDAVAPGTYLLSVKKPGYETFYQTLNLSMDTPRELITAVLRPVTGVLVLKSTPSGAEVMKGRVSLGKTPLVCTSLPLGDYQLLVVTPGYQEKLLEVSLTDRTPVRREIDLTSDSGTLEVRSEPAGAEVRVNGILRGTAPCTVERITGKSAAEITVTMEGYEKYSSSVKLSPGEVQQLDVVLKALPGSLRVVTIPSNARVYMDDDYQGLSDLTLPKVAAGERRVRVEKPGYEPMARNVTVKMDAEVTEEFRLESNMGTLSIVTSPAGASVFLDGKSSGTTRSKAGETTNLSDPLVLKDIAGGKRKVKVSAKGYSDEEREVEIEAGKTATAQFTLVKKFIPDYEVTTRSGAKKTGVLIYKSDEEIRLELRPGVTTSIPVHEVREHGPLVD